MIGKVFSSKENFSISDQTKISCIVNPKAANKKWKKNKFLRNYLYNNFPGEIIDSHEGKANTINAAKNLSLRKDIIVAAGGDGTIADVIQGIIQSGRANDILLGVIPLGSGNAFRKSLGIPKNAKKSLRLIGNGKPREIDLIDIDGTIATFASIGATAQVTLKKLQHKTPGILGHILASRIMLKLTPKEQEIELIEGIEDSGKSFDHKFLKLMVFDSIIGKTKHFGYSWKIAPKAKIDDGYIDITFFEISGWKYLLFFPSIYIGFFQRKQKHFKAKRIVIKGKNLAIQYNGELLGVKNKIEMKVLPRAIKVITPS